MKKDGFNPYVFKLIQSNFIKTFCFWFISTDPINKGKYNITIRLQALFFFLPEFNTFLLFCNSQN